MEVRVGLRRGWLSVISEEWEVWLEEKDLKVCFNMENQSIMLL